jgi:hypothetical protein
MATVSIAVRNMMTRECLLPSVDLNISEVLREYQDMTLITVLNGMEANPMRKSMLKLLSIDLNKVRKNYYLLKKIESLNYGKINMLKRKHQR